MCGCLFCCGCLCGCGWKAEVKTQFTIAKWSYCVGFTITAVLTWVLRDYAPRWFAGISGFTACQDIGSQPLEALCGGKEIAMRISFANFTFFMLHALLLVCMRSTEDPRVAIHTGLWGWKIVIWVGAIIGFMFVPSHALYGYAQFARVGSGFFLILQLILIIAFVYEVNEWLVAKEKSWSWTLLVGGAVVFTCLALVLIGISYHFYAPRATCSLNIFFITWDLIVLLIMVAIIFIPKKAHSAGLLTSAAVALYCTYLMYSALNSIPRDSSCIRDGGTSSSWVQVVAFFIALATIIYSTVTAGVSFDEFMNGTERSSVDAGELPYRAEFFHAVFALASLYIAMLFSNWQVSSNSNSFELDRGWISVWVKIVSSWLCGLLYIWSVVAPALFPDRDFNPPQNIV